MSKELLYEVIGKTIVGTYSVLIEAKSSESALMEAKKKLEAMKFGNYKFYEYSVSLW